MNVNHDSIIQKMIDELETARHPGETSQAIAHHAANVRVLADLLVDNARGDTTESKSTQTYLQQPPQQPKRVQHSRSECNHRPAVDSNPSESIFDF